MWLKTISTGGCGASPRSATRAIQRVRHIGLSLPSVSLICRLKNLEYFNSFAAISSAVSWQLSTSMNNSGTPSCGAVSTMSAWAPPLPGVPHVPVAGQRDLRRVRGDRPHPAGCVDGGLRGRLGLRRLPGQQPEVGLRAEHAMTVSLTAIGWVAPAGARTTGGGAHLRQRAPELVGGGLQALGGQVAQRLPRPGGAAVLGETVLAQIGKRTRVRGATGSLPLGGGRLRRVPVGQMR
ncbi:hypothetical protein VR46_00125 [Streptomyces sp. NRRL S-444]|nr:hypothetical protein VR46_00125 [Streptomyces sp. NRRL S-444]